jgi:hypothetical protein
MDFLQFLDKRIVKLLGMFTTGNLQTLNVTELLITNNYFTETSWRNAGPYLHVKFIEYSLND